jgi:hypothetical protein
MQPITITATFDQPEHAEEAQEYLLANDFNENNVTITCEVNITVGAKSVLEAQEAADVLRNYGAGNIVIHTL